MKTTLFPLTIAAAMSCFTGRFSNVYKGTHALQPTSVAEHDPDHISEASRAAHLIIIKSVCKAIEIC